MKKRVFSILMMAVLLVSALGYSAKPASAAGLITYVDGRFVWGKGVVFVFEASGLKNKDVKGAEIFAGSSFYHLGCTVNKEEGKVVCTVEGDITEYAGQTGIIYLAGQMFYVTIPGKSEPQQKEPSEEECPQGMGVTCCFGALEFGNTALCARLEFVR